MRCCARWDAGALVPLPQKGKHPRVAAAWPLAEHRMWRGLRVVLGAGRGVSCVLPWDSLAADVDLVESDTEVLKKMVQRCGRGDGISRPPRWGSCVCPCALHLLSLHC